MKFADVLIAVLILSIVMIIIIPISTFALDTLLIINITLSIFIMLLTLYIKEPLEFSALPTMLLITTLFRLALNLSSTKLILGNSGDAGEVIKTFGSFVIQGNLVVGIVVFIIIVAIQFIVITKGAERVSEVAARFTLDALPGKQMAIDADLNTGAIDEAAAKKRRYDIQKEADFYGAMDGASKFIKGDAIIGIIICVINIVGGLIIGVTMNGESISDAVSTYTLATVGDGLVSQIPALLISTSTGIVVTRSASDDSFGTALSKQLFSKPNLVILVGMIVVVMSLIPGFPHFQMLILSAGMIITGYVYNGKINKKTKAVEPESAEKALAKEKRKPENIMNLMQVELIELEFGYGIIPMVDANLGGDLLERVVMIRRQCAMDLGIILPSIRLRDNVQLNTSEYVIKIKGIEVARGEVMADHYLAINSMGTDETIYGIETVEPTFGLPALWITKNLRERAELLGYTTIDPPSVIATHLTEVIKRYGHELINRQQVKTLIENLASTQSALVEEVIPKMFSYGEIQKVLVNLLKESIPIRDMATIIETLADYGSVTRDTDLLTEYVRQNLKRAITRRFIVENQGAIITLDPKLEQIFLEKTKHGEIAVLEPSQINKIYSSLKKIIEKLTAQGKTPVVLTAPLIRRGFKRIVEQASPDLAVLSYNELDQSVEIRAEGVIEL